MSNDWPIPEDLSANGRKAAETIRDFFTEKNITNHGGEASSTRRSSGWIAASCTDWVHC
ncbi:hypothetical protein [Mycobacterium sp. 48b]|uniref:hypothetical protein n=1 Tax=Mycobacterium sp. 48b TaxID=3400426 RepID=UPI003AAAEDB9